VIGQQIDNLCPRLNSKTMITLSCFSLQSALYHGKFIPSNVQYSTDKAVRVLRYLEANYGVVAGENIALRSSHRGLMGGCTQIYCFLLVPPAMHTFSACTHSCVERCCNQLHN